MLLMCSGLQQNGVLFYRRQSDFVNTYLLSARLSFYSVFPGIRDHKSILGFQCRTACRRLCALDYPPFGVGCQKAGAIGNDVLEATNDDHKL